MAGGGAAARHRGASLSRRMAEIQPLRALYYDQAVVGPLSGVVAPPYDVIDDSQRAALLERSPQNVVAVDLPKGDGDATPRPASCFEDWQRDGVLVRDPEPRALGPHPAIHRPRRGTRTRRGFFCRVRIEPYGPGRIRPHERTHPGPKEDRLRLTRATRANISPIFSLYSDPAGGVDGTRGRHIGDAVGRGHRRRRHHPPRLAGRPIRRVIAAVQAATARSELLIADGHHRYETCRPTPRSATAKGRRGAPLHPHGLVALEDPGLTIFPTHRLVTEASTTAPPRLLARTLDRDFGSRTWRSSRSPRTPAADHWSSATSTAPTNVPGG